MRDDDDNSEGEKEEEDEEEEERDTLLKGACTAPILSTSGQEFPPYGTWRKFTKALKKIK